MTRRRPFLAPLAIVIASSLLFAACGDGSDPERDAVVGDITAGAATLVEPLPAQAGELTEAVTAACADPADPAAPDAARTALKETQEAWRRAEVAWLGPLAGREVEGVVDWPTDPEGIDDLLTGDEPATLDAEVVSTGLGADTRGLGAMEVVLARPSLDARSCEYLVAVAEAVEDELTADAEAWLSGTDEDDAYREQLADDPGMALDELVGSALTMTERIARREIGPAISAGDEADPSLLVEGPGGYGADLLQARIEGLSLVVEGGDGQEGLTALLDEDLATRLTDAMDAVEAAAAEVEGPLIDDVAEDPEDLQTLVDALEELRRILATEVVSVLGVTIGFTDGDGDGSG